jgi:TRAP-type C4-dicarboxylate transport system substrate-binding protein
MRRWGLVVAMLAAALSIAGCGSGAANKAGGSHTSVVLSLADSDGSTLPSVDAVEHFAARVERNSGGSLRVQVVFQAGGNAVPRVESRTIDLVRSGHFDLGVVGARAWDLSGNKSFRALQAPFLITSQRLLNRVVQSSVGSDMIGSLGRQGVVGLALVPEFLRHPIGLGHRFVSLADFAGARIRILPSATSSALIRALGATPLEISNDQIGLEIAHRRVDAEELAELTAPGGTTITGNLVFFGKALTFFANREMFNRLSSEQRRALQSAATETMRYIADRIPSESDLTGKVCVNGRRIVLAKPSNVDAIEAAVRPVYAQLEKDPATRRYIAQIRALKRTTPPDPPLVLPSACRHAPAPAQAGGQPSSPSILNGTYRWVLTLADARANGGPNPGDTFPAIGTAVLEDGTWKFAGADHDGGTYSIHGDRITFVWPRVASVLVFEFTRDSDGTLHLRPVLPMDSGDQFVWSHKPWRRIGPPRPLEGR